METKIFLFFLLAILVSCSDDDSEECIGYRPENVTEVNSPSSGRINESIEIEVKFAVYNGCGKFEKFIESRSKHSKIIEVQAKYEGCICTDNIPIITAIYEFTPSAIGEYELKFKSGETDYITVNIAVTD
ncbi:hypothetical protein [Cecembia lonarensis]|uniref:Uncharacterized protein n=1 Tax=Cecembia lonarensis (strain CCUG 58316 / KCTC 22772 / LW9) TaxID=1225176 RepID=K1LVR0_CECL9|nr:hypothetical protein [Cecembia lonarensis]EKB48204.1 hypothetical protein B879_03160 [Cecembia lonarensis LW9]